MGVREAADSACSACRSARRSSAAPWRSNRPEERGRRCSCESRLPPAPVRSCIVADKTHPLRILLADDHVTVRQGLKLLIDAERDMEVIGEAGDGNEAVHKARGLSPDVVVMDISMPGVNGLAATRALKKIQPHAVIVTLTRHGDQAY